MTTSWLHVQIDQHKWLAWSNFLIYWGSNLSRLGYLVLWDGLSCAVLCLLSESSHHICWHSLGHLLTYDSKDCTGSCPNVLLILIGLPYSVRRCCVFLHGTAFTQLKEEKIGLIDRNWMILHKPNSDFGPYFGLLRMDCIVDSRSWKLP